MSAEGQPPYAGKSAEIRSALLALPGAQLCHLCTVITQGGQAGATSHRQVCYGDQNWIKP